MIEYLVAFLAGTAVALVLARVGSKKLSVDEVLERVDDKLELVKRIPEVMKDNKWQYRIVPVHGDNNIIGVVTDEKRVTDERNRIKRTRIIIDPLKGKKKIPEWLEFYDSLRGKTYDISLASGTALVTLAKSPNIDDQPDNIEWNYLHQNEVSYLKKQADAAAAMERQVSIYRSKAERYSDMLSNLRAEITEKEELLKDLRVKYMLKAETTANLMSMLSEKNNEIDRLKMELQVKNRAIESLHRDLGIPADQIKGLGVDQARLNKTQMAVEILKNKAVMGELSSKMEEIARNVVSKEKEKESPPMIPQPQPQSQPEGEME